MEEINRYEEVARELYISARLGHRDQLPYLRYQLEQAKEAALRAIRQETYAEG